MKKIVIFFSLFITLLLNASFEVNETENLDLRIQLNDIYTLAVDTTNSRNMMETQFL